MSGALAFGARLADALVERGPLCVGIDPHPGLLEAWGLSVDAEGVDRFADICVRAFAGTAAVVKPQAAFFETFGSAGVASLERTIAAASESGALVIVDAKRGDIGSTMQAYAQAYLGPNSSLAGDAVTLSPYLGVGSLDPAFDVAAATGRGAFVLALTSNPEAPPLQRATTDDGRSVAQRVVDEVSAHNTDDAALGSFGVVVGATIGDAGVDLSRLNGPLLMPGIGAQGGTAEDVRRIAGPALTAVVPNVSREVLRHGPDVDALRRAVGTLVEDFLFLQE